MDELLNAEISPGTIHTTPCNTCNNDALTFDIVALGDTGVGFVGTIQRCGYCTGVQ